MAGSGVGRGRGWLNINKNSSTLIPPGDTLVNVTKNRTMPIIPNNNNHTQILPPNVTKYSSLFNKINTLDENDDGILLNQKLKNIVEEWQVVCLSEFDIEESVTYIYQSCLNDHQQAISKVVNMITSHTFITLRIHNRNIRNEFIGLFQTYFETRKSVQKRSAVVFRRSIQMFGEFTNKARLSDGNQIKFLAEPLIEYLKMLLETAEVEDLELFTAQLYLNGSFTKKLLPDKLDETLHQVRQLLVSNATLTSTGKTWLLLAIDVAHCRFGLLPSTIHDFYREQLGDKSMAYFQGTHHPLSVQTVQASKKLDSFQSNVNVLQVSTPEVSPINDQPRSNSFSQYTTSSVSSSQNLNTSDSGMSIGRWETHNEDRTSNREKAGRPILGAGARFNKSKSDVQNDGLNRWDKQQNSGLNGGGKKSYNEPKNKKGWEHDDRFENDYS